MTLKLTIKPTFILLISLVLGTAVTSIAQQSGVTFTKITTGAIVNDGGSSYGCAWGDYDNDGFIDLVVGNGFGQRNFLYRNNRDGTFTKIITGPIVEDPSDSDAVVWGDYDNDGDLDLFVANFESPQQKDALYQNNNDSTFTRITTGSIVNDNGLGVGAAWVDYDRDGWLDVFVANSRSQNDFLYHGNGDGTFTQITAGPVVMSGGTSIGCAWGDLDNDGDSDLIVANLPYSADNLGNDFLFINEGSGNFTSITTGPVATDGARAGSPAWGDYDNDGDLDLVVVNGFKLGENDRLYRNEGHGSFALVSTDPVSTDQLSSMGVAWADYDNDGWLDLFVSNTHGESNRLYLNRRDGSFEVVNAGEMTTEGGISLACAWGDYNNDGFLDLFVANAGEDPDSVDVQNDNYLYRNNGNTNHWLMLKLVGRASNRSAIGAKVRLTATIAGRSLRQLREISGGSGYCSQNDMRAHFGLGDATNAAMVRIEWPSGTVQELPNMAVNQILTVQEPPILTALVTADSDVFQMTLNGGRGVLYRVEYSTDLASPTPLTGGGTINWLTLTNFTATGMVTPISDPGAASAGQRFYRAQEIND